MLYGQLQKQAVEQSQPIVLGDLNGEEKERLVQLLFTGVDPNKAQEIFRMDDGRMIPQDEVKRLHDELYAYAEEAKPLVTVDKAIADVEIAKDMELKDAPVVIKGK